MGQIRRRILKTIAQSLAKYTNSNKVVLFTKELIAMTDKLYPVDKRGRRPPNGALHSLGKYGTKCSKHPEIETQIALRDKDLNLELMEKQKKGKTEKDKPAWKTKSKDALSIESINSRTTVILSSVMNSSTDESLLKRLETLNMHLKSHPDGNYFAVKEGVIEVLIKLKSKTSDKAIQQVAKETMSLLGHCESPPSRGIRVLAIDGGGMRGLVVIKLLQRLEDLCGRRLHRLFDYVCGVSTGAIITCCSVPPLALSLEKLEELYMELGRKVFKQNAFRGAGKLVFNCAYYETRLWEDILKEYVGSTTLLETSGHPESPKICALSTVDDRPGVIPFLFRNYSLPVSSLSRYPGSCNHTLFEAVRASAAAPSLFEGFVTGDRFHLDGGILTNNPAGVAVHEVANLWPREQICCLVSCGTGKPPTPLDNGTAPSTWKRIFDKILESATDTEAVHTILDDLMPQDVYFRLNPGLTAAFPIDEIDETKISVLEQDADDYFTRNQDKFKTLVEKLTSPRSAMQKLVDLVDTTTQIKTSPYFK